MNNYNDLYNYMDMNYIPDNNLYNTFNIPYNNMNNLLDPYNGFIRGNMFNNLYDPYKNYNIQEIKPTNDQEALLDQIRQYKFALTDLDLYLDIYPNDYELIQTYNNYLNMVKQATSQYEKLYGPLSLSTATNSNTWEWIKSPWPWEGAS